MGGNLKIGATVDVAEIKSGMDLTVEEIKNAAQKIPLVFDEAAGRTKAALGRISDDVKQSAQVVSIESARVAQATRVQAQAFSDLRNAILVARDAKVDDTAATVLLASAQQKVTAAAEQVAAAKKAEAEAVAEAAEEEGLSENVVVRAFQRAAIAIGEATGEIREQLVETAEAGGLEAEGIAAGFSGFSKLLGAGIAVGFAAEYIDGLAKVNVELEHLATKTGISITTLAGLQQILKEAGGNFETVSTGLVRMESNTEKLSQNDKVLAEAFINLGLKIEDVRRAKPEELLQMIATGMAQTADANVRANSAIQIFGRGGQELIPILREQGTQLIENAKRTGQLTGITDASAEAARRWTQDTARLSAQFRSVMIPIMEHAEDVIRGIAATAEAAAAVLLTVFTTVSTAIVSVLAQLGKFGVALYDLVTGNFQKMIADAKASSTAFADTWKAGFSDIRGYWSEVRETLTGNTPLPPQVGDTEAPEPGQLPGKKHHDKAFQRDEEQLAGQRLAAAQSGYKLGVQAEIDFWEQRLAAAKKGSDEYRSIVEKLAGLEEEKLKLDRKPQAPSAFADVLRSGDVEALNAAYAGGAQEQLKTIQDAVKQETQAYREGTEDQIRAAQDGYRATEQNLAADVALHRLTQQERIAALRQALAQENQLELAALRERELLDTNDAQKYQQDVNRALQITRSYTQQVRQLMNQAAEQTQKQWTQAYDRITNQFNQAAAKWVITGKGFAQSMAQLVAGITENFTRNVLKMAEQFLLGLALQKTGQKQQILADAKTAAANTYSAVSAIPVVGPFLAPPAAAGAFAAVLAFDSFDEGGVVRGPRGASVPVLAHAGERVLTPSQTQNFETLVSNSSQSRSTSNRVTFGDINQHFHGSQAGPRQMQRGIQDALRRGRLRLA